MGLPSSWHFMKCWNMGYGIKKTFEKIPLEKVKRSWEEKKCRAECRVAVLIPGMDFDAVSSYEPHTMQAETLCGDLHVFGRSFRIVLQIQVFSLHKTQKTQWAVWFSLLESMFWPSCTPTAFLNIVKQCNKLSQMVRCWGFGMVWWWGYDMVPSGNVTWMYRV